MQFYHGSNPKLDLGSNFRLNPGEHTNFGDVRQRQQSGHLKIIFLLLSCYFVFQNE